LLLLTCVFEASYYLIVSAAGGFHVNYCQCMKFRYEEDSVKVKMSKTMMIRPLLLRRTLKMD